VTRRHCALVLCATATLGWLDPSALPRRAAREYEAGKFDESVQHYNQALIDEPDSSLLHFNLGAAEYRRGQYEAAARAVELLHDDPAAAYNRGNALFRLGEAAAQKPQDAMTRWAEALVAYRRAIALDPADEDAKFNYEWVTRKIEELKQQQQNQEQQQDQQQEQQQGEQQNQEQQQEEQQQQEQAKEEAPPEQRDEQPGEQAQQPEPPPEVQQGGDAAPSDGEMTEEEATALLDGERNEELRPDEVIRRQLGAGDLPGQDW
jgi:Ca-activated chloride channel family protein